jgi:hypothetical protein
VVREVRVRRSGWFGLLVALTLVAGACGDDDDGGDLDAGAAPAATAPGETSGGAAGAGAAEPTAADPLGGGSSGAATPTADCATAQPFASTGTAVDGAGQEVALEATEIGVSDTTITIGVYAAVDNPFAPGLAEGNRDGVYIWRDWVNQHCGLAGRNVEVIFYDTKLDIGGTEFPAAQAAACGEALAFVGGYELFDGNVETMASCPDAAGAATGLPDLGVVFADVAHFTNPTSFSVIPTPSVSALYEVGGPQEVIEREGALRGVFLVPNDLPATLSLQNAAMDARVEAGIDEVQRFEVGGREEDYDPFTQALISDDANYAESGLAVNNLVRWRQNAAQLAPDADIVWGCASNCYDDNLFATGAEAVEGTYVWVAHVPFEEADTNAYLQAYLDLAEAGGYKVDGLGFQAFVSGLAMTQVIEGIVAEHGPNAVTRSSVLAGIAALHDFDAHGLIGPTDVGGRVPAGCTVLLRAVGGEFVRISPEERGTISCEDDNLVQVGEPQPVD